MDSYNPPESIGTKQSTNIPCMTPQWRHKWRHVKNTKITKNRQNHGFSLLFQAKLIFVAMMCVIVCLHIFLLQINQINKIKHSESVSWKQKTRFVCNFHWKSVFGQFSLDPALFYATPRHNPRSDFFQNGFKKMAWRKKVMKFQCEKITTSWDITKNVEGSGFRPPRLF